jgi:peptidoglycan-N-acetylglucosamine deacetylase
MIRLTIAAVLLALAAIPAAFADCPGNPDALGSSRVLAVDASATPQVGRKHFPVTLPLAPREVVLTFDDGPAPGTTERVLDALRRECVRAAFFLTGQNAAAHPALARRILAEGHTIAHHTYSHVLLDRRPTAAAEAEIDRGIAAVDQAAHGRGSATPVTPFFRFPGFASTPQLLERLKARGIVVFGADLWASDWNPMTPQQQLVLVLERLHHAGGGIILFHDTRAQTAAMLPALLRELRRQGYRIVHVTAASRHQAVAGDLRLVSAGTSRKTHNRLNTHGFAPD